MPLKRHGGSGTAWCRWRAWAALRCQHWKPLQHRQHLRLSHAYAAESDGHKHASLSHRRPFSSASPDLPSSLSSPPVAPFSSSSSSSSSPPSSSPSSRSIAEQVHAFNARGAYHLTMEMWKTMSRDSQYRYSSDDWSELFCDAVLTAAMKQNRRSVLPVFASLQSRMQLTTPLLYNRLLQLITIELHQQILTHYNSEPSIHGAEDSSPHDGLLLEQAFSVLDRMVANSITPDAMTHFYLSFILLLYGQVERGYQHYLALSRMLVASKSRRKKKPSSLSEHYQSLTQLNSIIEYHHLCDLFRLFLSAEHLAACELISTDLERYWKAAPRSFITAIRRLKGGQQQRDSTLTRGATQRDKSPMAILKPGSRIFFTSPFLQTPDHSVTRSPRLAQTVDDISALGVNLPALCDHYYHEFLALLQDPLSPSDNQLDSTLIKLRHCYSSSDLELAVAVWAELNAPTSSAECHLMLFIQARALQNPSPTVLDQCLENVSRILNEMQERQMGLLPPAAVSVLASLGSCNFPLPSVSADMKKNSAALQVAQLATTLVGHIEQVMDISVWQHSSLGYAQRDTAADSTTTPALLLQWLIRCQVRHPMTGTELVHLLSSNFPSQASQLIEPSLSFPSIPATVLYPGLPPPCYVDLIYHYAHLPAPSLTAAYHLFSSLLQSLSSSSSLTSDVGSALIGQACYHLMMGEKKRNDAVRLREIYLAAFQRFQIIPTIQMTDALIEHLGGTGVHSIDTSIAAKLQLLNIMLQLAQHVTGRTAIIDSSADNAPDQPVRTPMSLRSCTSLIEIAYHQLVCMDRPQDETVSQKQLRAEKEGKLGRIAQFVWRELQCQAKQRQEPIAAPLLITHLAILLSQQHHNSEQQHLPASMMRDLTAALEYFETSSTCFPFVASFLTETRLQTALSEEHHLYNLKSHQAKNRPYKHTIDDYIDTTAARITQLHSQLSAADAVTFGFSLIYSRAIRMTIYTWAQTPPPPSVLSLVVSKISEWRLDLDPYCWHVLCLISAVMKHDRTMWVYQQAVAYQQQLRHWQSQYQQEQLQQQQQQQQREQVMRMFLAEDENHLLEQSPQNLSGKAEDYASQLFWSFFSPACHSPLARSDDYLHLCLLVYNAAVSSSSQSVLPASQSLPLSVTAVTATDSLLESAASSFLPDAVALAMVEWASTKASPVALLAGLRALSLQKLSVEQQKEALIHRSFAVVIKGYLVALRAMEYHQLLSELPALVEQWLYISTKLAPLHWRNDKHKEKIIIEQMLDYPQAIVYHSLGRFALQHNEVDQLLHMFFSSISHDSSLPLSAYVITIKTVLLSGNRSRLRRLITGLERLPPLPYSSSHQWLTPARWRFSTHIPPHPPKLKTILKQLIQGSKIIKDYKPWWTDTHTHPHPPMQQEAHPSTDSNSPESQQYPSYKAVLTLLPASSALSAALRTYHSVLLSASFSSEHLALVAVLFHDLVHVHWKMGSGLAEAASVEGVGGGVGEEIVIDLPQLIECLVDEYVLHTVSRKVRIQKVHHGGRKRREVIRGKVTRRERQSSEQDPQAKDQQPQLQHA